MFLWWKLAKGFHSLSFVLFLLTEKVPIPIANGTRPNNASLRTCYSPPLLGRAIALEFKLKESFSKCASASFSQHAPETPYSIFGQAGVVRIEYSVEGACGAQRPWSETGFLYLLQWLLRRMISFSEIMWNLLKTLIPVCANTDLDYRIKLPVKSIYKSKKSGQKTWLPILLSRNLCVKLYHYSLSRNGYR